MNTDIPSLPSVLFCKRCIGGGRMTPESSYASLGDMLLKRYTVDFVTRMQSLSSPDNLFNRIPKEALCSCQTDNWTLKEGFVCMYCQGTERQAIPFRELEQ